MTVFETMAKFRYFGMTPTGQNYSHDQIKSKIKEEDAWYRSIRNLLSSVSSYQNYKDQNIQSRKSTLCMSAEL
jgi:hypothetical protein